MAELSPTLGFLTILKESLKLVSKNGKLMAPITLLSLLLPSLLLLAFCHILKTIHSIIKTLDSDLSTSYLPLTIVASLILLEIIFILAFFEISHKSGMATILVSATSYTDTNISSQHLYSRIKTAPKANVFKYLITTSPKSGTKSILSSIFFMLIIVLNAIFNPNPFTIIPAVVVVVLDAGLQLYAHVTIVLSHVVSVVEEKSEAVERAEELIQGQRQHGFTVNLFISLVLLIVFVGFWWAMGGNIWTSAAFWMFFINSFSLLKMYGCVAYTVLYFRCKEYQGDKIMGGVGSFDYSKPSDKGGDVQLIDIIPKVLL